MATVMAVRAASGFIALRDVRAVYEVAKTALATMIEIKTTKPPKVILLWLKSTFSSPRIYKYRIEYVLI